MRPVIAERTEDKGPRPAQLRLVESISGCARLQEVQSDAVLLTFEADHVHANIFARHVLERAGVDTSFAQWGGAGEMLLGDA